MYSVVFDYHLNTEEKYTVVASCKSINGHFVYGITLKFINDQDDTIRVKFDKDLFDDIEYEATEMLLEEYYNPEYKGGAH